MHFCSGPVLSFPSLYAGPASSGTSTCPSRTRDRSRIRLRLLALPRRAEQGVLQAVIGDVGAGAELVGLECLVRFYRILIQFEEVIVIRVIPKGRGRHHLIRVSHFLWRQRLIFREQRRLGMRGQHMVVVRWVQYIPPR